MPILDEQAIIEIFVKTLGHPKKPFSKIGDDVAYFPDSKGMIVLKNDMLVRSTDIPKQMQLWQSARKAVIMCASDILVKGARPFCFMLSFGIPRAFTADDIISLAKGVKFVRDELSIEFVGGDTNECDDLVIDCTMLGTAESIITRAGAKNGDIVYVSGEFGLAAAGLKILSDNLKTKPSFAKRAVEAVLMPKVKPKLADIIRDYATASIDSSDGLALSLYQMAEVSKVSIHLEKVPSAVGLEEFAEANMLDANELALYGGEEYDMVFCINRKNAAKFESACKSLGYHAIRIGVAKKGIGIFLNSKKIERKGWIHFMSSI